MGKKWNGTDWLLLIAVLALGLAILFGASAFAADIEHEAITEGNIHVMCQWEWADAAAKTTTGGSVDAADVGRCGVQTDTGQVWVLLNNTGPVWLDISTQSFTSADCDAETGYNNGDVCLETGNGSIWVCEESDGDCAGDWVAYFDGSSHIANYVTDDADDTMAGDLVLDDDDVGTALTVRADAAGTGATVGVLITTDDDDSANYTPLEIRDDSGVNNDLLCSIDEAGTINCPIQPIGKSNRFEDNNTVFFDNANATHGYRYTINFGAALTQTIEIEDFGQTGTDTVYLPVAESNPETWTLDNAVCIASTGKFKDCGAAPGGGAGAFDDSSDPVVMNTATKDVVVGSSQINTAKLSVDGDADQVQLAIQGHTGQSANLIEVENVGGTVVASLDPSGNLSVESVSTPPNADPSFTLEDSTANGQFQIDCSDAAGPEMVCDLEVDTDTGTLTPFLQLDGVNDQVEILKPAVYSNADGTSQWDGVFHGSWVIAPGPHYDVDTQVFLFSVGLEALNGIDIIQWSVSCNVDPDTELDLDLKRATAWIGLGTATVMDELDTTAGVSSESTPGSINGGATVANGQVIYLEFGTDPAATTCAQMVFEMWWNGA